MKIAIINCSTGTGAELSEKWPELKNRFPEIEFSIYETDIEGKVINALHEEGFKADGIIINPGRFAFFSISIGDAVASIKSPVVIVRDIINADTGKIDFVARKALGVICGFGFRGYELAVDFFQMKPVR